MDPAKDAGMVMGLLQEAVAMEKASTRPKTLAS
jgi:hypothetical protein